MTSPRAIGRAERAAYPAIRHFGSAVGETTDMHRGSDRAVRRARAQGEGRAA